VNYACFQVRHDRRVAKNRLFFICPSSSVSGKVVLDKPNQFENGGLIDGKQALLRKQ
jgi:hypothetical protein